MPGFPVHLYHQQKKSPGCVTKKRPCHEGMPTGRLGTTTIQRKIRLSPLPQTRRQGQPNKQQHF
uniref:Uncharacterized protein n=1 Tax=Arundo donax TaxID=35708 RepID=A0A0A8Z0Y9_ARUDO